MCGIAGRICSPPGTVGRDLVELMQAQRHRGSDSTGFGLYGLPRPRGYVVRAVGADRSRLSEHLETFLAACRAHGSDFLTDPTWDALTQKHVSVRVEVDDPADSMESWLADADHIPGFAIQSVGRTLEIIKDLGDAYEVADKHGVRDFIGTHGLANARMATESMVSPTASHPFWARPYPDIAIVHNGQLTNYYLLTEKLQRKGYDFKTQNDSEVIAIWMSDQMAQGRSMVDSLELSKSALDGCFTYMLSTIDTIGFAKDKFAIKPLVVAEEGNGAVAIGTEEQAVRKIYRDEVDIINYDGPLQSTTWPVTVEVPA
jgi:methylamine---glutamate N-methyltransferase subunit A